MSADSWIVSLPCRRREAEALTETDDLFAAWPAPPVLVATEEDEDADEWRLDAYFEAEPGAEQIAALTEMLRSSRPGAPTVQHLPAADWVTLSQADLRPVAAGRFHVHTSDQPPSSAPGTINFCIDAGQAFGTGHHDTTAGCLNALDALRRRGRRFAHVADIGTGTGLLAFAALKLWPRATATASDIDPVSIVTTADNARSNGIRIGHRPGTLALVVADGTAHPLLAARGPYDLICANILAGPLISLAPALAVIAAPGATLLLAGLLARQRPAVIAAYRRAGWRLDDDGGAAEWPTLRLTRRAQRGWRRPIRADGRGGLPPGDYGSW